MKKILAIVITVAMLLSIGAVVASAVCAAVGHPQNARMRGRRQRNGIDVTQKMTDTHAANSAAECLFFYESSRILMASAVSRSQSAGSVR